MRLTVYTDYALRVLIYIAVKPNGSATIAEIAVAFGISRAHLMKVAHRLGIDGFIGTVRGRGGGLRLAYPAQDIGVGDVIRATEPDLALAPCFDPINADCAILPTCVLRRALHEARSRFFDVLDGYTIADLARPGSSLRRSLGLPSPSASDPPNDDR